LNYIPYGRQYIDEDDIKAVVEVLRSDWLTTGPKVKEFEDMLAQKVGAKYTVAFSSGTAALHAAYFAAGVGKGDEVITSPITFAATANAACFLGGRPVFVDIDENTLNINAEKVQEAVTARTKVIAPVDFTGQPADLEPIIHIARKHKLVVVEDAAHALGATYKGRPVGGIADMTVFSFHPVKHITTGEGGAVATDNEEYYHKLMSFRTHGIEKEKERLSEYHGPWYHEMQFLGYNYRITDIQCALGISQLRKLDAFLCRRKELAEYYNEKLKEVEEIQLPVTAPDRGPAWHLYVIKLTGKNPPRREVFEALQKRGIGVQVHYIPVYRHPYYRQQGYMEGLCPVAEDYYGRCLSLPLFPAMTDDDINYVINGLKSVIGEVYR